MTTIRQWHTYIGLFTAPSVLFFTLTGSLQLYSLHEAHGTYRPPAVIEKLASVHKDQVFAFGDHHSQEADAAAPAPVDDDKTEVSTIMLKAFFFIVALGLSVSTGFGLWMGLTRTRQRKTAWGLVIAGVLIPIALIAF